MTALACVLASATVAAVVVEAQDFSIPVPAEDGAPGTPEELAAFQLVQQNKLVEAREAAEAVVAANPRSYVGHFVLGMAQHYGEANFPRALYHENEALRLYTAENGESPGPGSPWRWHARLLRELAATYGDLERYEDRLRYLAVYNELYEPDLLAERAWPLMKMGRFAEARLAAEEGLAEGSARQVEVSLNALCAVEFEAGNDGASYDACRRALEWAREQGSPNAVDLTNFAEASRSLFKLDEAERILLEATRAPVAWYGNPWLELGELYTRQGRFAEALGALREVPGYRAQRPPHVRDADRNESRRALSAFYMVVGRPDEAVRITDKALVMPDRRAHNSRDPAQDRAIIALVDRRARLLAADMAQEGVTAQPWYVRLGTWAETRLVHFDAWMSGRQASRSLADDDRLVGSFRIGTSKGAITPPWLVGDLVEVMGAGVVRESVRRARAVDARPGAAAYYDAFEAEAALASGDEGRCLELGRRAVAGLGATEAMLAARVSALLAEAARQRGDASSLGFYDAAFQRDPGVFRRLRLTVPVHVTSSGGEVADAVVDALDRSPRFDVGSGGLTVRVTADPTRGEACLLGPGGAVLACGSAELDPRDDVDTLAQRVVDAFHAEAFAPRVDLTQGDIGSLDGSPHVERNPLRTLFGDFGGDPGAIDGE